MIRLYSKLAFQGRHVGYIRVFFLRTHVLTVSGVAYGAWQRAILVIVIHLILSYRGDQNRTCTGYSLFICLNWIEAGENKFLCDRRFRIKFLRANFIQSKNAKGINKISSGNKNRKKKCYSNYRFSKSRCKRLNACFIA